jgi:hypothetical protein
MAHQPIELTKLYLKHAQTCTDWADAQSDPQMRQEFLDMAMRWRTLAEESDFIANLALKGHGPSIR